MSLADMAKFKPSAPGVLNAGFDVVGARDLDQDSLRHTFRDFVDKATSSGPDTVAFVYVGGYGLQLEGENYFIPVDAKIARDSDIPSEALRISDYSRPLAVDRMMGHAPRGSVDSVDTPLSNAEIRPEKPNMFFLFADNRFLVL